MHFLRINFISIIQNLKNTLSSYEITKIFLLWICILSPYTTNLEEL